MKIWKTRNKYHSKKLEFDSITFDSHREAERYIQLKLLERTGKIQLLKCHPQYELVPAHINSQGVKNRPVFYEADFEYWDDNGRHIEDVKPKSKTGEVPAPFYKKTSAWAVFQIKRKMFEFRYPKLSIELV